MWTASAADNCVIELTRSWHVTADRLVEFGELGRHRPLDLLRAVRSTTDLDARDELAHSLILLAQAGHADADQLLLVTMLPRVVHLTRTCRGLRSLPVRDAQVIALGAMWEAIRIHPRVRPAAVLHRLGLDALSIVTKSQTPRASDHEVATDPEIVDRLREAEPSPSPSPVDDLATLLRWALEQGSITREDVRIIAAVDLGAPGDRERLADELGIEPASLTRRAHRLRGRLRDAVGAEIERVGTW